MITQADLFLGVSAPAKAAHFRGRVHLPATARKLAETMRAAGASVAAIADALGVSEGTAWTRLAVELERALPGGRRPGRPRWEPSDADRTEVERMAAEGVSTAQIAETLAITPPTLRRWCAAELAAGRNVRHDARAR